MLPHVHNRRFASVPSHVHPRRRIVVLWVGLATALLTSAGCKVSKARIQEWAARKDAARLAKVVGDTKQTMDVRQEAAYQLVQLDRFYVLEKAIKGVSTSDRHALTDDLVKRLLPHMNPSNPDESAVIRAKDGLFSAWYFARPKVRRQIEKVLVRWMVFGPQGSGGDHNIDKILGAFGRHGADLMAGLVTPDNPQLFVYDKDKVVSPNCLLGHFWKTASAEARAAAAKRYIQAAQNDPKLRLANQAGLLLAIGAVGGHEGVAYLVTLLQRDRDVRVKAAATVGLRIAGQTQRALLGASVLQTALDELKRLMHVINLGKPLPNPTLRGVSYVEHLFELITLFSGEPVFAGLTDFIAAPNPKLEDPDLTGIRTFLRLLAVGFLMRLSPTRALTLGYEKLLPDEAYPQGYLSQTVLDSAIWVWKQRPKLRNNLLRGLRLGLANPSWVAKIIAVQGLGLRELQPREAMAQDLASLRGLMADKTPLKGDDWRGATLGDRAKKAVEVLAGTK